MLDAASIPSKETSRGLAIKDGKVLLEVPNVFHLELPKETREKEFTIHVFQVERNRKV